MSGATTSNIAANGIVVEVLNRENYRTWKALVKNYLMGKDLWYGVIRKDEEEEEEEGGEDGDEVEEHAKEDEKEAEKKSRERREKKKQKKEWEIKNRKALHAIQVSCGKTVGHIKRFEKAEEAWDHLKTSFSEDVIAHDESGKRQSRYEDQSTNLLETFVKRGFLEDAKMSINVSPDDIFYASPDGRTVLHHAIGLGRMDIVKKLVMVGKKRLLKMQDDKGFTPLALLAKLTDDATIAELMVHNGGEELLTMTSLRLNKDQEQVDEIPVLLASAEGHKNVTRYLFSKTPLSFLRNNTWEYGLVLLARCISNQIFDVAAAILEHDDAREIPLGHEKKDLRPIYALAHMPSAFPSSGAELNWWKRFVYNKILSVKDLNKEKIEILVLQPHEIERPTVMTHTLPGLGRLFGRLRQFVQTSILLQFDVFKKIYEKKMEHHHVLEILDCLCKRASILSEAELRRASAYDAMLQAAKNGITEFIVSMKGANSDLLLAKDASRRGIFAHAIVNRREEVFQLIHDETNRDIITSGEDTLGNNLLHIAAELGPSWYLDRISNAALQMQRELQWFREVKNIVPQWCHDAKDPNDKTAREVFTDDHKELLKSGQQWAKDTASSFTLVGTLIITIMFAAAFTVPGGNNSDNGTPILLHKTIFTIFIVSDAISLVTSSSSVLMFIGILTSRYAEDDFMNSLPLKLLFAIVMLFLSVASMMCAFCAALALTLKGHRRLVIAAMWLAFLPILVFVPSLVRLASEISRSTVTYDKLSSRKREKKNQG